VRKFKIVLYFIIFSLKVIEDFWGVPQTRFISMRLLICWDISTQHTPETSLIKNEWVSEAKQVIYMK